MTSLRRTLDIGVDLDGVCYDFLDALRWYLVSTGVRPLSSLPDATTWNFFETDWQMELVEFISAINAGVAAGVVFRVGTPFPGVRAGLEALLRAGHRIHIITDRAKSGPPGFAEAHTRAWLAEHQLPFTTLTLSGDKTTVRTDVFIDDRPENYLSLRGAGVDAYLRHHLYNAHVAAPANRRVATFTEFAESVLASERLRAA